MQAQPGDEVPSASGRRRHGPPFTGHAGLGASATRLGIEEEEEISAMVYPLECEKADSDESASTIR